MHKKIVVTTLILATLAIGAGLSFADKEEKHDPMKSLVELVMGLDTRVHSLEVNTHVNIAGGTTPAGVVPVLEHSVRHVSSDGLYYTSATVPVVSDPSQLPSSCASRGVIVSNFGTVDQPNYVYNGWCPESHDMSYFIRDSLAKPTSFILVTPGPILDIPGVQTGLPAPTCVNAQAGNFTDVNGTTYTGFFAQCTGNNPVANEDLKWLVLN